MGLQEVKKEISEETSLERWARRCSNCFTKKTKRELLAEMDNMIWSGSDNEITRWCHMNKVYDEITENEIEDIWKRNPQTSERSSD